MSEPVAGPRTPREWIRDGWASGMVLGFGLVLAGFVAVGLAWRGTSRTTIPSTQVGYMVSGGIGGLALIATGLGLWRVQAARLDRAVEQERTTELLARVASRLTDG
jgi:hypothetical protein